MTEGVSAMPLGRGLSNGTPGGSDKRPLAAIFGCAGAHISNAERSFFRETDPLGFILFARNCQTPDQIRNLIADLRDAVGRDDACVLIDQEGGRVARLKPPQWRAAPAPARFVALAGKDPERGVAAARLNARLIAEDLRELGITVDCAPVLDIPQPGAHDVIGDRAAGDTPDLAVLLGRAACQGFLDGGILPVIKHVPGHGRAMVDSHKALPIVDAPRQALETVDFAPFRALNDMPWAMTAHVVYTTLDGDAPATTSKRVIGEVIRGFMGFDGVLVSDDLGMGALGGSMERRAADALAAGCDLALHCSGDRAEMEAIAAGCRPLDQAAETRLRRGEGLRGKPEDLDKTDAKARLDALLEA
jgi:beta-N-acetylhexosaminidase